jgi:hypothetical protein
MTAEQNDDRIRYGITIFSGVRLTIPFGNNVISPLARNVTCTVVVRSKLLMLKKKSLLIRNMANSTLVNAEQKSVRVT